MGFVLEGGDESLGFAKAVNFLISYLPKKILSTYNTTTNKIWFNDITYSFSYTTHPDYVTVTTKSITTR
jgi:hypothetical protein